jgi:hypothetical protein
MENHQASPAVFSGAHLDDNESPIRQFVGNAKAQSLELSDERLGRSHKPEIKGTHPSFLTAKDVVRVYKAIAFAMWKHGVIMNTHITINWTQMGVGDGAKAVKLLGKYNAEAAKWLRVGAPGQPVQRASKRQGLGTDYFYVHVHENGGDEGFHTHQLCFVPVAISADFFAWSRKCFTRLMKRETIPARAFWPVIRNSKNEGTRVDRCWAWFRYLTKQMDQGVCILDDDGAWRLGRDLFKPWPYRQMKPLPVAKAVRVSENIGASAQAASCFVSRYITGEWDRLYQGDELNDRQTRLRQERDEAEWQALEKTLSIGADYPSE